MKLRPSNNSPLADPEYFKINKLLFKLTCREWDVVMLLCEGLTSPEIGLLLFVEARSIDNYRTRISKKLKLRGRNTLFRFCFFHQVHLRKFYKLVRA
ncbi:response regulator transcription factor [Dyadobacter arcticus]